MLSEHSDLSILLCFSKQRSVENIQGKFQKNSLVTLISVGSNINLRMFRDDFLVKKTVFDERSGFNIFPAKMKWCHCMS